MRATVAEPARSRAAAVHETAGDAALAALLRHEALPVLQASACVAGCVVVVQGERQALLCVGEQALGSGQPVTPDTPFSVASLAKAFVALTLARLADAGACSLDDPVRRWVPELRWPTPELDERVTLRDVLANRSGVGPTWPLDEMLGRALPVDDVLARLRHAPVLGALRARWAYLNLGFVAAARAAERAGGEPYHRLLAEQVLQPLGMRHSASWPGLAEAGLHPVSAHGDRPVRVLDGEGYANHQGAGWMYLSAGDAARWMRWWCTRSPQLLSAPAMDELMRPQVTVPPAEAGLWMAPPDACEPGYGFGWAHCRWRGHALLQHSGATVGATAHLSLLPASGLGVAVFLSGGELYRAALAYRLLEALQGQAPSHDWLHLGWQALAAAGTWPDREADTEPEGPLASIAAEARNLWRYTGHYQGAACGAALIRVEGRHLSLDFAEAPAWNSVLRPLGESAFAVELRQPNEGLRFMRPRPPGRFVGDGVRITRFEHPCIETLHRRP
jgi:CubicO group peptidase (beta-lactamase class C family)